MRALEQVPVVRAERKQFLPACCVLADHEIQAEMCTHAQVRSHLRPRSRKIRRHRILVSVVPETMKAQGLEITDLVTCLDSRPD